MIHARDEHVIVPEPPLGQRAQLRSVDGKRAGLQDGCSRRCLQSVSARALWLGDDHVQLRFPAMGGGANNASLAQHQLLDVRGGRKSKGDVSLLR
jgi:hypothetical protein